VISHSPYVATQSHPNSYKINPKAILMMPRNAPKAILGASWFEVAKKGAQVSYNLKPFGHTRVMSAVILGLAGRQGAPQIEHFGSKARRSFNK